MPPAEKHPSSAAHSAFTNLPATPDAQMAGQDPRPAAPAVINLQVCFRVGGNDVCSAANAMNVQYVNHAFGGTFATADMGVGQVALSTGELSVPVTDATIPGSDISAGRNWLSKAADTADTGSIFGPGWQAVEPSSDAGALGATIFDRSAQGVLMFNYPSGATDVYQRQGGGTGTGTYVGRGLTSAIGSQVTLTAGTLVLQDATGTTSTWVKDGDRWKPQLVQEPLQQGKTRVDSDATSDNVGTYRSAVTGQYSSGGAAAWCADLPVSQARTTRGCQVMDVTITPADAPAADGNYPGRVSAISVTMFDPQADTPAMATVVASRYAYNDDGLLVRQWNPQLDGPNGSLNARYDYDIDGSTVKLTSVTPPSATVDGEPALIPFTLTYDEPLTRLQTVSRDTPDGDTATTKVVYGVPLAGDGLPDLTIAATATWDQSVAQSPVNAVAVFTPGNGTPNVDVDDVDPGDWPYAGITYMNSIGATTNTAEYGAGQWLVSTQEYNSDGYPVASLSAANRALALSGTCTEPVTVCAQGSSAAKALLLSAITEYKDPTLPGVATDQWSPAFDGVVDALKTGTDTGLRTVRTHNKTTYNQGAPTGDAYTGMALPTTITSGVKVIDGRNNPDLDVRTSTNGYGTPIGGTSGWLLRQATSASQNGVTTLTAFNSEGNPTQIRQPMSNGNDAGTTVMSYYGADASPGCVNTGARPEWDGIVCASGPAAQPAGQPMPTTYKTMYTMRLQPVTVIDQSGSASRTSTTTYDRQSGRVTGTSITGDQGQSVPDTSIQYNPDFDAVTSTTAAGVSVSTTYDTWGRSRTYTDAAGTVSTVTYNLAGQIATANDGKGTYTYTYDNADPDNGPVEHRGLVTRQNLGLAGGIPDVVTAEYGPGGGPNVVTYPNGVTAQFRYNTVGALTAKEYATAGEDTIASWAQTFTGFGQVDNETGPLGPISYDYDQLGRLATVTDQRGGVCTVRTYGFNNNSDRVSKTLNTNSTTTCPAGKGSTSSTWVNTFDSADRQNTTTITGTNAGTGTYTYDSFGRTTTIPAVDTSNTTATGVQYYVNDTVYAHTQGGARKQWGIDPLSRILTTTTTGTTNPGTVTNHYAGGGDAPAWVSSSDGTTQRYASGPDGALAVTETTTNGETTAVLNLTNPHGDVVATIPVTTNVEANKRSEFSATDEYGLTLPDTPTLTPYQWEGAAKRSNDTLGGLIHMGARNYSPATGRFLSVDPIPGGNANPYTYPTDPINGADLDGNAGTSSLWDWAACGVLGGRCAIAYRVTKFVSARLASPPDSAIADPRRRMRRNARRHFVWNFMLMAQAGLDAAAIVTSSHEMNESGVQRQVDSWNNRLTQRTQWWNALSLAPWTKSSRTKLYRIANAHFNQAWSSPQHRRSFACERRGRFTWC